MKKLIMAFCLAFGLAASAFAQNQALLVIDIQNDYFKGGRMELVGVDEAAAKAKEVIDGFHWRALPVIYIQHISNSADASFFAPNTKGAEISDAVKPSAGDKIIVKHFPNSFIGTGLEEYLKSQDITELVIIGMMSHMCVDATTRAAADLGFKCTLVSDACATRDLTFDGQTVPAAQVHAAFMSALQNYANVVKASEL